MNRLSAFYRKVAREFAERAVRELDGKIQSIVLYGSVARGEAGPASDIDILVLTEVWAALLWLRNWHPTHSSTDNQGVEQMQGLAIVVSC